MKRLIMTSFALTAMAYMAPSNDGGYDDTAPTPGRGLEASLQAEQEALAKGDRTEEFQTGTIQSNRGLGASLKAVSAGAVSDTLGLGLTGKVTPVSKKDTEGLLMVDSFTGQVIQDENTPEWAQDIGLFCAVLGERHVSYAAKLGPTLYTADMRQPEVLAFEDVEWLAIEPSSGLEQVIEADYEHRAEVLAGVLGIDRETGAISGDAVTMEIGMDNSRTGEEMAAFTEAQGKHFEEAAKTGTNG